jgi:SAM-dependent methyltransferase
MIRLLLVLCCVICASYAQAQERFSLFVGSDINDVRRMFEIAGLRDNDFVIDLGSGDGRIVLEAARLVPSVRGRGIEIDGKLVADSIATAQKEALADRVQFLHQDAFDADLKQASIITMWLFPELMRLLRTKILAEATPGTRVVTRIWDLGSWRPDHAETGWPYVYLWVVPARVAGNWAWQLPIDGVNHTYSAVVEQRFQEAEGVVRSGNRRGILEEMKLKGDEISFKLTMTVGDKSPVVHQFNGRAQGDNTIVGTVSMLYKPNEQPIVLPWRAERARDSTYFAPTGLPKN